MRLSRTGPGNTPTVSSARRRPVVLGIAVVTVLTVLVLLLLRLTGVERADAGTVIPAAGDVDGRTVTVQVPVGAIELTVGDPVESVSADASSDGEDHAAPRSGGLVPVRISFDARSAPAGLLGVLGGTPLPTSLTLVAGDERHELPAPYAVSGPGTTSGTARSYYVAVDDADGTRLEVTYDGVAQSVDVDSGELDPGRAAALYDVPDQVPSADCPATGWEPAGTQLRLTCSTAGPQLTAYDPELGWAEDGRAWLVAGLDLSLQAVQLPVDGTPVAYLPRGAAEVELTLDGEAAARTVRADASGGLGVWDVPAGSSGALTVSVTQGLEKADDGAPGPRDRSVTLTRTLG